MIPNLDRDELERAFGRRVTSYDVEPIDPHLRIHSVTGGVYRVRADTDTLVVKVVRHGIDATPDELWQAGADVAHRNYWKREWLAFDSGLLANLPGELRAPRVALTTEHGSDECWVWMEDVQGRTGAALQLDDYATVAHAVGTTQGSYASGATPLPDHPWLSRDWLRGWVRTCTRFVETVRDDSCWRDARLKALEPLRRRIVSLWERREELFTVVAEAPLTLTHWDFWPTNVYVGEQVVAIDWSQIGLSGVTNDLDQMTLDPIWMHVRPDESIQTLEDLVLPAYAAGLREGGLDIAADTVRRWYAATAALRYTWLAGAQADLAHEPDRVLSQEQRFGRDLSTITTTRARVVAHALALGEQILDG